MTIPPPPNPDTPGPDEVLGADHEIVARIRSGNVDAFEQLYGRFAPALLGFAQAELRSRETAEELVQELFLALWRHREKWELTRSLKAYLFRALRHHIVSHRRTARAREERRAGTVPGVADGLASVASGEGADHHLRERELLVAIERAVASLSPRCRQTFVLVRQQHLSYLEAAEVLGVSVKAVEMNMVRAFAALRRQLAPWRE